MESNVSETKKPGLPKPNNIVTVPTSPGSDFFKWWCVFLKPFINLTNRERDVIASFLNQRYELSKSISDQSVLDTMVMSETVKNKVIVNNTINPRLIPNIRKDDNGCFQLLILFKETKKKA